MTWDTSKKAFLKVSYFWTGLGNNPWQRIWSNQNYRITGMIKTQFANKVWMPNKIYVIRLDSSSIKVCFLLNQVVNIYHVRAVSVISGVSQSVPTQPDTWCCVGMTIRCQEALLGRVFASSIMKVKLLLNAVVSSYYITLWTVCKGLPANTL